MTASGVSWPRRHGGLVLLLAALAAFYLPWTWSDQLGSLGGDSAVYVLSARQYAPYLPFDFVTAAIAVNSQFPPLYPVLLMVAGGAADLHLAHAVTTLCLLGACAAMYFWLLALGLSRGLSIAIVAIFALMPGTYLQSLYLLSESLYLLLSLASLLALSSAGAGTDPRRYWIAMALLAAAFLARTAALALLPAFALALWLRRPRGWIWMLPAALAPAVLWGVLHRPEQSYIDGFLRQFFNEVTFAGLVGWLWHDAKAIAWGVVSNLMQTTALLPLAIAASAIAMIVAGARFFRLQLDAWYVLAYLALVTIWPYPAEAQRFAWLAIPFLLGYLALGLVWVAERLPTRSARLKRALPAVVTAGLLLAMGPGFAFAVQRHARAADEPNPAVRHLPEWYAVSPRAARAQALLHLELGRAIRELADGVPPGECVFAIKPALVAFYGGRDSFVPPFEQADDALFQTWMQSKGCRYFILLAIASPSFSRPFYPLERIEAQLELLDSRISARDDEERIIGILARLKPAPT